MGEEVEELPDIVRSYINNRIDHLRSMGLNDEEIDTAMQPVVSFALSNSEFMSKWLGECLYGDAEVMKGYAPPNP